MLVSNAKTPEQARDDICELLAQTMRERQRTADRTKHKASKDRNELVALELRLLIDTIKGMHFSQWPEPREEA